MLFNVYFPCSGTANRSIICENLLSDIEMWRDRYGDCEFVIAGDFNCDFDGSDAVSLMVQTFIHDGSFTRCDDIFPEQKVATYVNEALRQQSCIDYVLTSAASSINNFVVMDPSINFSDHLPITATLIINYCLNITDNKGKISDNESMQWQMRWDKADKTGYYYYTGNHLTPLVDDVNNLLLNCTVSVPPDVVDYIAHTYDTVVSILKTANSIYVPRVKK